MDRDEILRANGRAYDRMARDRAPLCRPAADDDLRDPLGTVDPAGWLEGEIRGRHVLCLAAGGGRQSSLYAAAGGVVTVVDLSPAMLELDRQVAAERGYPLRLVNTSMDELSMFRDGEFDLVVQPVSTCYLPDLRNLFAEVARVLRPSGLYISQHKTPTSLQAAFSPNRDGRYELEHTYYRDRPVPPPAAGGTVSARLREPGAVEFLHRWEQLVGGICRAGFVVEDLVEPVHAKPNAAADSFAARARFVAPYVRIKARRRNGPTPGSERRAASLWVPGSGRGEA